MRLRKQPKAWATLSVRQSLASRVQRKKSVAIARKTDLLLRHSWFRVTILAALLLCLAGAADAQTPITTVVTDAIYSPGGFPVGGSITITANTTMTSQDGFAIPQGTKFYATIGANGGFSVALIPNIGAAPAGSSYTASYATATSNVTETWVVPTSSTPVNLPAVRVRWIAAPSVSIPSSQFLPPFSCTVPGAAQKNLVLRWTPLGWLCAPDNTGAVSMNVENPTPADSGKFQWKAHNGITLTRVSCTVDSGSAVINLDVRTETTVNATGVSVLTTPLTCPGDGTTGSSTNFSSATVPGLAPMALDVVSLSGTPTVVRVVVEYLLQ